MRRKKKKKTKDPSILEINVIENIGMKSVGPGQKKKYD
jgi:hypothetical protein